MSQITDPAANRASFELEKDEEYKRKALRLGGTQLLALSFSTLGVIYSDIGECTRLSIGADLRHIAFICSERYLVIERGRTLRGRCYWRYFCYNLGYHLGSTCEICRFCAGVW